MLYLTKEEIDEHLSSNQDLIAELQAAGDKTEIEREVFHTIFFPDAESKDVCIAEVVDRGYVVSDESYDEETEVYLVDVSHVTSITPQEMEKAVLNIASDAKKHGGIYDGWYTSVESV